MQGFKRERDHPARLRRSGPVDGIPRSLDQLNHRPLGTQGWVWRISLV